MRKPRWDSTPHRAQHRACAPKSCCCDPAGFGFLGRGPGVSREAHGPALPRRRMRLDLADRTGPAGIQVAQQHPGHETARLRIGWNAADAGAPRPLRRCRPQSPGRDRTRRAARQVGAAAEDVLDGIETVDDPEAARRGRHQLHEPGRAPRGNGERPVRRLGTDDGVNQTRIEPVGRRRFEYQAHVARRGRRPRRPRVGTRRRNDPADRQGDDRGPENRHLRHARA